MSLLLLRMRKSTVVLVVNPVIEIVIKFYLSRWNHEEVL